MYLCNIDNLCPEAWTDYKLYTRVNYYGSLGYLSRGSTAEEQYGKLVTVIISRYEHETTSFKHNANAVRV